jgi:beta-exotoxin I transport system permease protein
VGPTNAAELTRRGVADHRAALAGWCLGAVAYVALIAAIYPSLQGSASLDKLVESYPDALKSLFGISGGGSLSSGAGFLDAELFSFMLPLLVLVLAIGSGVRTFAGEEDAGRLEVVLAYPVRRRAAVLAKGAAVGAEVVAVCACSGLAIGILDPIFGLELSVAHVAQAVLGLALLGLLFGWLALGVGAATGRRGLAVALPAGLAAGSYLVSGLHSLAGWLDPFRFLSAFWWIGASPLQNGIRGVGALVVALAAVAALVLGAVLVGRRDLEVP